MSENFAEKQYKEMGFKAQRLYPNEELVRFIGESFFDLEKNKRENIRILELGCGSGANLWMIARENFDAYGIDISETGLKLCAKMLNKWECKATIKLANMLDLPYLSNSFDAVVDVLSLEHLPFSKHGTVYAEVMRVLKPEGKLFSYQLGEKSFSFKHGGGRVIERFTVDAINNPEAPFAGNGLTCFPNEKAVQDILNRSGFQNVNIENVLKTYRNRKINIQFLVIKAQKPQ